MRVPKPVFLVKRFAAAVLIVAVTLVAATPAPAAEGPALAPAEYKPLPVGTKVRYDTWAFTVTRSEDLEVAVKTDKRKWVVTYGLFGKQGSNIYTKRNPDQIWGLPGVWKNEYDDKTKSKLKGFWPLAVGKKADLEFTEDYRSGIRTWRLTLEVLRTEHMELNGLQYPTYVVREHASSEVPYMNLPGAKAQEYVDTHWYNPDSGLVLKTDREWIRGPDEGSFTKYSLISVSFPSGTTTHALKGTKILVGGEADKALLAEVEKLKQEAKKAEKARAAEIAKLKREAEETRKAGGSSLAAASGKPTLPPAEFKPLPVGTIIKYSNRRYSVTRTDGFETVFRTNQGGKRGWLKAHALFGEFGDDLYAAGMREPNPFLLDEENRKKIEALWPLTVGKKTSFRLDETISSGNNPNISPDTWTITLEVSGVETVELNGFLYPAYVIEERGSSADGWLFVGRKWYHPPAGLVIKTERTWTNTFPISGGGGYSKEPRFRKGEADDFALVRVTYPKGTTTHALKGTKPVYGVDKVLLAEVERLKKDAEAERKTRQAEIARLKREAEEARQAAFAGGDKARAAEIARLEKEVEQRHWDSVKDSPELAAVEDYLKRYPSGRFAAEAKARVAVLQRLASASKIDFGNYHALVIGIDDYKYLPNLEMAVKDAKAVAKVLKEDYGFKVTLLTDPNHGEIMDAFDELQETLTGNDNLLIYYAGHGWLNEEVDRGYWLPANAKPGRRRHWISNATITDTLKGLSAKHVMVVADSCYSGTLVRAADVGTRKRGGDYWKEMASKWARVAITSGGLEPVADKGGGENSPFAKAFIDTLKENRSVMDGTTLFTKMRRPVMVAADQTPQYSDVRGAGHDGGDFIFVRKK